MHELSPPEQLAQMIHGALPAQAVYVAARLGIADLLAGGPQPVESLATQTRTNADALYRLLRALASVGVFSEGAPGSFELTPLGELLRSDAKHTQRPLALMFGGYMFPPLAELLHSVQTGKTGFEKVHGEPLFQYLSQHPDDAAVFDAAMTSIHGAETQPMIDACDFNAFRTIVDIGGGNASVMLEVLRAAPRARGIVFDLPPVIERTRALIERAGMGDRCFAEGGDFFTAVPPGGDAYVLRHIVHDWDDERAALILRRCREAGAPGAKVLVVESVIPPGNEPHPGKWLDLIMLSIPGGRERTAEQYRELFARAGLKLTRIVPTKSPVSVIEGIAS